MTTMTKGLGLYLHIPFCSSKCPYCDFYSFKADERMKEDYTNSLVRSIKKWQDERALQFATVYFGGGTPSQLGSERLCRILDAIACEENAEVTIECNPFDLAEVWSVDGVEQLKKHGCNRISMGMQSAVEAERKKLGRRAGREQAERAVEAVKSAGINNFSLDLMLGIPNQTVETIRESVDFCAESGANHVSAYMLKIEQGTPFEKVNKMLNLPDEDECCEMYLAAVDSLAKYGYEQYEISNFAKAGFESRHNLCYWDCREYLGLGAAAHSFLSGKRFYYQRDAESFINGAEPIDDGEGGDFEEYAMLRLRLSEGLTECGTRERFGFGLPEEMRKAANKYAASGYLISDENGIRLTPKGFLISNTIISDLL